jgi:hypothetical protein
MITVAELRNSLRCAGYSPIPVNGKRPASEAWEQKLVTNPDEIALWDKVFPYAKNTGILTRITPTIDIDILNPEAAVAVEELARERFEERGFILVRIGRAPKRAILLRTEANAPFKKIARSFVSPSSSERAPEKIEVLGDGQQVVAFGIHPDTHQPYRWFGGEPGNIRWDDLPFVSADEAQQFVEDAARLLVSEFGYTPLASRQKEKANGGAAGGGNRDWEHLISAILEGAELHDSICAVAAKLVASGMADGAAVNLIRGWMECCRAPRDERWRERFDDVPRAVGSARKKFERETGEAGQPEAPVGQLIKSSAEFVEGFVPPDYLVDGLLQRRYCYSLTARTGDGKTALALLLAACVDQGIPFGGHTTEKGRVLVFAGENPDDSRARWIAMSVAMNFDISKADVHFIPGRFKISALIERITKEVEALGGVSLIIVDTSAAFYESAEENDNVQQGAHARRLRSLVNLPGGPCVIVNCHPVKNAADDNLNPRGGGAFVAEMDGNLTAMRDDTAITLHWQVKFRGPDFAPLSFILRTDTYEQLRDSKGRLIPTVIAKYVSHAANEEITASARADEDLVLQDIKNGATSFTDIARARGWYTPKNEPNRSKAQRIVNRLKRAKLVVVDRGRHVLTDKGKKATQ